MNCERHIDVFSPNCVERNFGGTFSGKLNGSRRFTGLWIVWIKVPTFEAIARSIYNFYNSAFFGNAFIIIAIRNVCTIVSLRTFDKELPSRWLAFNIPQAAALRIKIHLNDIQFLPDRIKSQIMIWQCNGTAGSVRFTSTVLFFIPSQKFITLSGNIILIRQIHSAVRKCFGSITCLFRTSCAALEIAKKRDLFDPLGIKRNILGHAVVGKIPLLRVIRTCIPTVKLAVGFLGIRWLVCLLSILNCLI